MRIIRIKETDSTNHFLQSYPEDGSEDMLVAVADFQTAGRGQGANHWESEPGSNLLFSVMLHPKGIPTARQYLLSMLMSVALHDALSAYGGGFTVKWPNDLYWHDRKISGTLIEMTHGQHAIRRAVIGVGVNVNQTVFRSSAPNPVSLAQILGSPQDREDLLTRILEHFQSAYNRLAAGQYANLPARYHAALYRREGFHPYRDAGGRFMARILQVEDDGHLLLEDAAGCQRKYGFKEVEFLLDGG